MTRSQIITRQSKACVTLHSCLPFKQVVGSLILLVDIGSLWEWGVTSSKQAFPYFSAGRNSWRGTQLECYQLPTYSATGKMKALVVKACVCVWGACVWGRGRENGSTTTASTTLIIQLVCFIYYETIWHNGKNIELLANTLILTLLLSNGVTLDE